MSPQARAAERLARFFGLTYLSAEGYEKLASLLAWVRPARMEPPEVRPDPDIVKPPPERFG